jgi:CTP synthase
MRGRKRKYIVILGSMMSGLGKGILTSSIGRILQSKGMSVVPIKFDGYLNVDCGTMNPFRHGEVFVLDDGTECDMDLGTYERFLNMDLGGENNPTGGKIFKRILEKERRGEFLGGDVQFVPHLTNEIKEWIRRIGDKFNADVILTEVGGTVGDLENGYFIEAMRQLSLEEDVLFIQLTYVPSLFLGEPKTKPTQHATRLLTSMGVQPHMLFCRESEQLTDGAKEKISMFCNVPKEAIFDDPILKTIYELPLILEKQRVSGILLKKLGLKAENGDFRKWGALVEKVKRPKKRITIAITGKYTAVADAYVSIKEALVHAGAHLGIGVNIKWIETTAIEEGRMTLDVLDDCDGIIVPGGFGKRGVEGKIACIEHARKNKIPFLGLCLGMQLAVIEYARHVCGMKGANSTEFDQKTQYSVIDLLPEQRKIQTKGATMRLGGHDVLIKKGTVAHGAYKKSVVRERFRHRYEVNPDYVKALVKKGFVFSGKASKEENIMQIGEIPNHPFFVGTQFHPEFTSRLERPHPLFISFLREAGKR